MLLQAGVCFGSWIGLIAASCDHCDASRGLLGGRGGFQADRGDDDGTRTQWGRDSWGEQSCNRALLVLCLVPFSDQWSVTRPATTEVSWDDGGWQGKLEDPAPGVHGELPHLGLLGGHLEDQRRPDRESQAAASKPGEEFEGCHANVSMVVKDKG